MTRIAASLPADLLRRVDPGVRRSAADQAVADAVEAAIAGDTRGWDALFDLFHPVVRRYAMARSGDAELADEVAQEVMVAAVGGLPGLRDRSRPAVEGWLLRVARNKLADTVRRQQRERRRPLPSDTTVADAGEIAQVRFEAASVLAAMEGLTDDQREVLVRRFVLDHSLEQVAAATGRPVGAVKSLQHRAISALERRIGNLR